MMNNNHAAHICRVLAVGIVVTERAHAGGASDQVHSYDLLPTCRTRSSLLSVRKMFQITRCEISNRAALTAHLGINLAGCVEAEGDGHLRGFKVSIDSLGHSHHARLQPCTVHLTGLMATAFTCTATDIHETVTKLRALNQGSDELLLCTQSFLFH